MNPTTPPTELELLLKTPLIHFRIDLHKTTEHLQNKPLSQEEIQKTFETLLKNHPNQKIQNALSETKDWLFHNGPLPKPLTIPETQAALGLGIFLNEKLPEVERKPLKPLFQTPRIQAEILQAALHSSSFIGNKQTKVQYGPPGSWFYFHPSQNLINIDLAQALILGLQNSRAILFHEIGHSEITLGRTPKMEEIKQKLNTLLKENKEKPLDRETLKTLIKLDLELQMREIAFQYLEDAAVNTYTKEIGKEANQKMTTSILRNYTIIGLTRSGYEKSLENQKPLAQTLQENLKRVLKEDPKTQEYEQELKALGYAYPLHHQLAGDNNEQWEMLGTRRTNKILEMIKETMRAAEIQPLLQDTRETRLNPQKRENSTKKHFEQRTQTFDEIFEKYLSEHLKRKQKQVDEIPEDQEIILHTNTGTHTIPPNQQKEKGKPNETQNPDQTENGSETNAPNDKSQNNPTPSEGKPSQENPTQTHWELSNIELQNPHQKSKELQNQLQDKLPNDNLPEHWKEQGKTIEEILNNEEVKAKQQQEVEQAQKENSKKQMGEQVKASQNTKSILENIAPLPEGKRTYDGVVETLTPQITKIASLLKSTILSQKENTKKNLELFPDKKLRLNTKKMQQRLKKIAEGKPLSLEDFKQWETKQPQESPSITRFLIHMDLTGSTYGEVARMIAISAVVLKEAAKRIPEIQVIAIASQGKHPQILLSPEPPKSTKKQAWTQIQKETIGNILKTGCGQGSNEIDSHGIITSLQEAQKIPIPPNKKIGKTHFLLVTDGGIAQSVSKKIQDTLNTLLQDPLLEFGVLITDGSTDNNLVKSLKEAKLIRKVDIKTSAKASDLLANIAKHFKAAIYNNPITLQPESQKQNQAKTKILTKKIEKIGIGM